MRNSCACTKFCYSSLFFCHLPVTNQASKRTRKEYHLDLIEFSRNTQISNTGTFVQLLTVIDWMVERYNNFTENWNLSWCFLFKLKRQISLPFFKFKQYKNGTIAKLVCQGKTSINVCVPDERNEKHKKFD